LVVCWMQKFGVCGACSDFLDDQKVLIHNLAQKYFLQPFCPSRGMRF